MFRVIPVLTLLLAFAAEAQTPDPIQGCINPRGRLRVVTDTGLCKATETGITWPSTQAPDPAPPSRFQLVGFTSQPNRFKGNLAMNVDCRAEFAGSRVCEEHEITETTTFPSGLTGIAFFGKDGCTNDGIDWVDSGASGARVLLLDADAPRDPWTGISGFANAFCNGNYPIACCAPVP